MSSTANPEALLIHISGHDSPGITAACTGILAAHDAAILDIGQAVVHENLALGILVVAPEEAKLTALKTALHDRMNALGLETRFRIVNANALEHPMLSVGKKTFIVTLLGRAVTARILARVTEVIARNGFNVDRIEKLSDQICGPETANACVELAVSGDLSNEAALRSQLLAAAQEFSIDIACQHDGIFRLNRRLFVFDMDSTLIQGEVIDELAKLAGVGEQVVRITEAAMRGELDFDQSFTRRVALLKGLPAERVYSLLGTIPLAVGAERLFRTLKLLGFKTAILSGGFNFFARSLQERFGIDHIHSNELEIVDGVVTGRVIPPIINGARKAQLLGEIATVEGISLEQVVAVGDGANDIPMLNRSGMGIAYRAKPLVRQQADQSLSKLGLDGLLYLIGVRDRELVEHEVLDKG
jgi:phosphoserine phosphatase